LKQKGKGLEQGRDYSTTAQAVSASVHGGRKAAGVGALQRQDDSHSHSQGAARLHGVQQGLVLVTRDKNIHLTRVVNCSVRCQENFPNTVWKVQGLFMLCWRERYPFLLAMG